MPEPQDGPAEQAQNVSTPPLPPVPPASPPAKKAAAKKSAPAWKAPAKKAAAKKVAPAAAAAPEVTLNGAKETAAQAKSTVEEAPPIPLPAMPGPETSRLPVAAAVVAGVLAIIVVLLVRRK